MAVNDVVDLLRMLRRDDGAELEQAAGPEAITVVQEMDGVIRERLRQSDMYFSLWDEFDQDPDSNRAELIGAIEAAVEGDAEFGVRLQSLEEEYDELVASDGPGSQESDDAGVLVAGHFEDATAIVGAEGSVITSSEAADDLGGVLMASQGDMDGETMIGHGADASPLTQGETIGGSTYVYEQFLPDEDLEDSAERPGTLYDSPVESAASVAAMTTGDIRSIIQPVEMALQGNLEVGERDRKRLQDRLARVEQELQKGQALNADHLREDLVYVRDAAPDLWEMLVWNLRDVGELLPVTAQSVLGQLAGPSQQRAAEDELRSEG
ncbi:MAG: hypothetical protein ACM30E_01630 [Nitrososphaerales archaeon]